MRDHTNEFIFGLFYVRRNGKCERTKNGWQKTMGKWMKVRLIFSDGDAETFFECCTIMATRKARLTPIFPLAKNEMEAARDNRTF